MTTAALEAVGVNLEALADWLDGFSEVIASFDVEECVILRSRLDDLMGQVRGAVGATDIRLLSLVDVGQSVSAPGYGQIVVEAKGKTVTHGSKLAARLAARVADTPCDNDGAMLPPAALCAKTADEIVKVFALDNASATFRSTELKGRGLRASEFKDYLDGEPRVRFMR